MFKLLPTPPNTPPKCLFTAALVAAMPEKVPKIRPVEIWCLTLYLFRRLGELTLIVPCYFGHSSVNLEYKITL